MKLLVSFISCKLKRSLQVDFRLRLFQDVLRLLQDMYAKPSSWVEWHSWEISDLFESFSFFNRVLQCDFDQFIVDLLLQWLLFLRKNDPIFDGLFCRLLAYLFYSLYHIRIESSRSFCKKKTKHLKSKLERLSLMYLCRKKDKLNFMGVSLKSDIKSCCLKSWQLKLKVALYSNFDIS